MSCQNRKILKVYHYLACHKYFPHFLAILSHLDGNMWQLIIVWALQ